MQKHRSLRNHKSLGILTLGFLAVCFNASRASAQVAGTRASFSLPFEVHWGMVVLRPGQYTLTLPGTLDRVVYVRGNKQTVMLHAQDFSDQDPSGRSSLTLVRNRGIYTVRALSLEQFGTFFYAPPKGQNLVARNGKGKQHEVASAPELIRRVPILLAGAK